MGKILLTIGLIGLCHAAYSATQHRSYMRLTEHDIDPSSSGSSSKITSLPIDILVQTLVCLLLSCLGIISISAKFKPIKITSEWENKTWDNVANRTSFYSFNHRGKYLFSNELAKDSLKESVLDDFVKIEKPKKRDNLNVNKQPVAQEESSLSETDTDDVDYSSEEQLNSSSQKERLEN